MVRKILLRGLLATTIAFSGAMAWAGTADAQQGPGRPAMTGQGPGSGPGGAGQTGNVAPPCYSADAPCPGYGQGRAGHHRWKHGGRTGRKAPCNYPGACYRGGPGQGPNW